ncbi:MAG TPA: alpha-glucuronidase family glycosyl hydrolase [Steroidobacteraceae bacterium]|nr:alpha-glucuronidase family glycosyl hydrolase [Steroidobacteraceae bacterium]
MWVGFAHASAALPGEDGYDLWLRYRPLQSDTAHTYKEALSSIAVTNPSPTLAAARDELVRGLSGLLGTGVEVTDRIRDGAIVLGTPTNSTAIRDLKLDLRALGREGYVIENRVANGLHVIVIAGNEDVGVLYGAFHLLRLIQTEQPLATLNIRSAPKVELRMLNHWDNLNRYVERGYAGQSLWDWHKLPDYLDPRYTDYARANASIGINATVLTNVNANATVLTPMYLEKVAALANVFRPYGIRVFLTARFSAPIEIGGLKTADPLDPNVAQWWKQKVDEIYRYVPDFGGFLIKANSEGQPGPQDYKRSHADGANMFADALAPHGGVVIWRAFVYSNEVPDDRVKQAYTEFVPLDGKFRDNVVLQVKNGPLDFQPREPFHPLFGATPHTSVGMEFQITKEYLGFATHLVYLGTLFEEALRSDTFARGKGSTVAKVVDGSLFNYKHTVVAGVSNIGSDRNWTGSQFDQANWYVFGRLAWDPELDAQSIANEWVRMTFNNDPKFVDATVKMMMGSREAAVNYMTPLGLHHIMGRGHHYGPGPWVAGGPRADWTAVYYHRADENGIGFDRTSKGSNAVAQYFPPVAAKFADRKQVPDALLLWFHHVGWDERMRSGRTLWDELVVHYTQGVQQVHDMRATWQSLAPYVDARRHWEVDQFLRIQEQEAQWWRDACIAYFQSFSKRPLPQGYAPPAKSLEYYESLSFPYAPGNGQ